MDAPYRSAEGRPQASSGRAAGLAAQSSVVPAAGVPSSAVVPLLAQASSGGLRVRPARAADLVSIAAIEGEAFTDPWSVRSFRSVLERPDAHMTVAEWRGDGVESVVTGYLVAWFVADEGEIANVAVHPDWRRRGVGAALLDDVLAAGRAVGVSAMYLEVRASNAAAQALYAGRGFHPVGRRRRYYTNPVEDALILRGEPAPPSLASGA